MRLALAFTVFFVFCLPSQAKDVVIYTEDYPPYNYRDNNGQIVGGATANVRELLAKSGLSYEIRMVPWARAITGIQSSDTALIYSIVRMPSRETNFTWIAPLAPSSFYLFSRRNDSRVFTFQAVREGLYTGACFHTDITCELMRMAGFPAHKVHPVIDKDTGDFLMVRAGRADLFATEKFAGERLRIRDGFGADAVKPVLRIAPSTDFYLAGGKGLNAEIAAKIKKAYETLVASDSYQLVNLEDK